MRLFNRDMCPWHCVCCSPHQRSRQLYNDHRGGADCTELVLQASGCPGYADKWPWQRSYSCSRSIITAGSGRAEGATGSWQSGWWGVESLTVITRPHPGTRPRYAHTHTHTHIYMSWLLYCDNYISFCSHTCVVMFDQSKNAICIQVCLYMAHMWLWLTWNMSVIIYLTFGCKQSFKYVI